MKYFKGTVYNLAEELEKYIDWDKHIFPSCDYAYCPETEGNESNKELADIAEGWCGIHKIDSGFDNTEEIEVVSNYWGGGSGQYAEISEDYDVAADIVSLIEATLESSSGFASDDRLLIAEINI